MRGSALTNLLLALLLAASMPLALLAQGCSAPEQLIPTQAALEPPDDSGLLLASSYDDIFQGVLSGLQEGFEINEKESAAVAEALAAFDEAVALRENPDQLDAYSPQNREAHRASLAKGDGIYTINPRVATVEEGLSSKLSPSAKSSDGYLYVVAYGALRVFLLDGNETKSVVSLPITDYEGGEGTVISVVLAGKTLAVQLQSDLRQGDRASSDYLLAAYGGVQTTVLFFDVSAPDKPTYLKTLGVSGVSISVKESNGKLHVVTSQATVPASGVSGWNFKGEEATTTSEDGTILVDPAAALATIQSSLKLRENDPASYLSAVNNDGTLTALAPEQVYLPKESSYSVLTTYACFDIESRSCSQLFAIYNPPNAEPVDVLWGENSAYFIWRITHYDEETNKQVFSSQVAQVALGAGSGASDAEKSGITKWVSFANNQLYSAFLEEREGSLLGAVEEVGDEYQRNWAFKVFNEDLYVAENLTVAVGAEGDRLGSFAMLDKWAYAGIANDENISSGLKIIDMSDLAKPVLAESSTIAGWPQKIAEMKSSTTSGTGAGASTGAGAGAGAGVSSDAVAQAISGTGNQADNLLIGYGSELARQQLTRANIDENVPAPPRDEMAILEAVTLSSSGAPAYSSTEPLANLLATENWRPSWSYDLHAYSDLDVVGVPLFRATEEKPDAMLRTHYALYAIDEQGVSLLTVVDLLAGKSVPFDALEQLKEQNVEDGFGAVSPSYDETSIYLLCVASSGSSLLPTQLIIIDRLTLEVTRVQALSR